MERGGVAVTVVNATPPLGPVQGKAPIIFALPALIGHRERLRDQLPEVLRDRPDSVFLIPVTNDKKAAVWRVFWEKGNIRMIEEYNAFSDAKALVDSGLGDEENRERILSRLSDKGFLEHINKLKLPKDIESYSLMPMPPEGVRIHLGHNFHSILSIAEQYPTYFDLAATPFSGVSAQILESVIYSKDRNRAGLTHSGDCNFNSTSGDTRAPDSQKLKVLAHSIGATPTPFAVTVSGYQSTPLIRFEKWRPTVAAIDHKARTLYYVGVRLDEATAGKNTVCVVMMCRPSDGGIHVTPLPGPYGMGDVNSLPKEIFADLNPGGR